MYTHYLSPIRATRPTSLFHLDFITRTILGEQYRSLSSSLCNFLHSPVTPSLLAPNILLNPLFSNTLSLCSSFNVSDQVSHSYKTTGRIIVLYIFLCLMIQIYLSMSYWREKNNRKIAVFRGVTPHILENSSSLSEGFCFSNFQVRLMDFCRSRSRNWL